MTSALRLTLVCFLLLLGCTGKNDPIQKHEVVDQKTSGVSGETVQSRGEQTKSLDDSKVESHLTELDNILPQLQVDSNEIQTGTIIGALNLVFKDEFLDSLQVQQSEIAKAVLRSLNRHLIWLSQEKRSETSYLLKLYDQLTLGRCGDSLFNCHSLRFLKQVSTSSAVFLEVADLYRTSPIERYKRLDLIYEIKSADYDQRWAEAYITGFSEMLKSVENQFDTLSEPQRIILENRKIVLSSLIDLYRDSSESSPVVKAVIDMGQIIYQSDRMSQYLPPPEDIEVFLMRYWDRVDVQKFVGQRVAIHFHRESRDEETYFIPRLESYADTVEQIQSFDKSLFASLKVSPITFEELKDTNKLVLFYLVDSFFHSRLSEEAIIEIWNGLGKVSFKEFTEFARRYFDVYVVSAVSKTNAQMKRFFLSGKWNFEDFIFDAMNQAALMETYWKEIQERAIYLDTTVFEQIGYLEYIVDSKPIPESLRKFRTFSEQLPHNVLLIGVYPQQALILYKAAEMGWNKDFQTFWGPINIDSKDLMRNFMEGRLAPWFDFALAYASNKEDVQALALVPQEIVISLEYMFKTNVLESFDVPVRDFFQKLVDVYLDASFRSGTNAFEEDHSPSWRAKFSWIESSQIDELCDNIENDKIFNLDVKLDHFTKTTGVGGFAQTLTSKDKVAGPMPFANSLFENSNSSEIGLSSSFYPSYTAEGARTAVVPRVNRLLDILFTYQKVKGLDSDSKTIREIRSEVFGPYENELKEILHKIFGLGNRVMTCLREVNLLEIERVRFLRNYEKEYLSQVTELFEFLKTLDTEDLKSMSLSGLQGEFPDWSLWTEPQFSYFLTQEAQTLSLKLAIENWLVEPIDIVGIPDLKDVVKDIGLISESAYGYVFNYSDAHAFLRTLSVIINKGFFSSEGFLRIPGNYNFKLSLTAKGLEDFKKQSDSYLAMNANSKPILYSGSQSAFVSSALKVFNENASKYQQWNFNRRFGLIIVREWLRTSLTYLRAIDEPLVNPAIDLCSSEPNPDNCMKDQFHLQMANLLEHIHYLYQYISSSSEELEYFRTVGESGSFGDTALIYGGMDELIYDDYLKPNGYFDFTMDYLTSPYLLSHKVRRRVDPDAAAPDWFAATFQSFMAVKDIALSQLYPVLLESVFLYGVDQDEVYPYSMRKQIQRIQQEISDDQRVYLNFWEEANSYYKDLSERNQLPLYTYYLPEIDPNSGRTLKAFRYDTLSEVTAEMRKFHCSTKGLFVKPSDEAFSYDPLIGFQKQHCN